MIHHTNKLKNTNYMTISIDLGKALDNIQHPFMIKTLNKVGSEETHLNIKKKPCMTNLQPTSYLKVKS